MDINITLEKIYNSTNIDCLFDGICSVQHFIEQNGDNDFFEEKMSRKGYKIIDLNNKFTAEHINKIFENKFFLESILNILEYRKTEHEKDHNNEKIVPTEILRNGCFANLFLNCCFYFIAIYSDKFSQINISFFGKTFWLMIEKLEIKFEYRFSKLDILNCLEGLIYERKYFLKKRCDSKIDYCLFYNNLIKTRIIIGNYLIDFLVPIILSNVFKTIIGVKKKIGEDFSFRDSANRLRQVNKNLVYIINLFSLDSGISGLEQFKIYFNQRESRKIIFLTNLVFGDLEKFSNEEMFKKIDNSENILNIIKEYFFVNYSVFSDYRGPRDSTGQWGSKSFLNTIKFFTFLSILKKSNDEKWKINSFVKYFSDWIDDLNENINYFSELDDYKEICELLSGGETDLIEFKSTFGLPVKKISGEESLKAIKRSMIETIAKAILAFANTSGGTIFIGVVEKIDEVSDDIKPFILERDGIYFLDTVFTLKEERESMDSKRLALQEQLRNFTNERMDYLDSLFLFNSYKIFIESKGSCIEIIKIDIKKSERLIFMVKENNWISLPKRLKGRVELINPVDELTN